jgi:propanol-preferring alcohol dehydrogenase
MILDRIASLEDDPSPLTLREWPTPVPGDGEVLIRVAACGVCHTELDEIEGRTPPPQLPVVPGHQVVGVIEQVGTAVTKLQVGQRVGVGWIHSSSGGKLENLSDSFRATGRDVDGGYAEYMTVGEGYAYPIPSIFSDQQAAPLLCAGAVGYRALMLCRLQDGQGLGLTGFGASAHLVLQLSRHLFPDSPVFVFARSARERDFALQMGAEWSGDTADEPPQAPQAIIDTTPAWRPVLAALEVLRPGGRLVINAIRKESHDRDLMADVSYERHLWREKEVKTVANVTADDIRQFLSVAADIPLQVEVEEYSLQQANDALQALRAGGIRGAKVLKITDGNK